MAREVNFTSRKHGKNVEFVIESCIMAMAKTYVLWVEDKANNILKRSIFKISGFIPEVKGSKIFYTKSER